MSSTYRTPEELKKATKKKKINHLRNLLAPFAPICG